METGGAGIGRTVQSNEEMFRRREQREGETERGIKEVSCV